MDRMSITFSSTKAALRAHQVLLLMWSSWLLLVGILSALAGQHRVLFSATNAAMVHWAIEKPVLRPGSFATRFTGKPWLSDGSRRRLARRSLIDPRSVNAIVRRSMAWAMY